MPLLLPCVVNCDSQTLAQSALAATRCYFLTLGLPMADMVQEVVALVSNTHAPELKVFWIMPDIFEACVWDFGQEFRGQD